MRTLLFGMLALIFSMPAQAQDTTAVTSKGWQVGFYTDIAGWSSQDISMIRDIGWGLTVDWGYNFSDHFGIYAPFSMARFNPSSGGDYNLYNIGIGGEYRFGTGSANVRPVINASYNKIWFYQNMEIGNHNITSSGPGIGGGLLITLKDDLRLRIRYNRYWSTITNVTVGRDKYQADGDLSAGQLLIGIVGYF